jgi:NAD(P)-dependent dehydrogenase (short-subunit alcohol dehydrogenase family)
MHRRVCVVTGASSGIGRACADRLAARDWIVAGASRRPPSGVPWQPLAMDVDDDASVTTGIERILADHGRLDAVITSAGYGLSGPVETTSLNEARAQLETNFWGTVRVVRAALPHMRSARGGRVVLIGSLAGLIGLPFQAYYSASKYALEGFGEALAYEVSPFGIDVTLVEPGNAVSGFTGNRRRSDPDGDSPYAGANHKAVTTMERDERDGIPSEKVAAVVERVLEARTPPRRVTVGNADERLGALAKRLIPHRVFERLARGALGL